MSVTVVTDVILEVTRYILGVDFYIMYYVLADPGNLVYVSYYLLRKALSARTNLFTIKSLK